MIKCSFTGLGLLFLTQNTKTLRMWSNGVEKHQASKIFPALNWHIVTSTHISFLPTTSTSTSRHFTHLPPPYPPPHTHTVSLLPRYKQVDGLAAKLAEKEIFKIVMTLTMTSAGGLVGFFIIAILTLHNAGLGGNYFRFIEQFLIHFCIFCKTANPLCCIYVGFPQTPMSSLWMNQMSLSHLPVPLFTTWLPFATRVMVDPDTRLTSSQALDSVTFAAVEVPSTVWSHGSVCAAVDKWPGRVTWYSAAPVKLWVSIVFVWQPNGIGVAFAFILTNRNI